MNHDHGHLAVVVDVVVCVIQKFLLTECDSAPQYNNDDIHNDNNNVNK